MAFPNEKELKKIRKNLNTAKPSYALPENATKADELKYALCEKFVVFILKNNITQAELARRLDIDTARLNEIVKYRINLFTLDKLIDFTQRLDPNLDIRVA